MLASIPTKQIHFIDICDSGDVDLSTRAALAPARDLGKQMSPPATISLERDTPELARTYEQAGILQFHHGKFLIGPLALKAGDHVLDIGAGTGRLTEFAADLVGPEGRVVGIDPLENRIAIARQRETSTLAFRVGRAEDLSHFAPGEFDVVYLNSVFHWIADKPRALREIHRVLKPGGRLGLNVQDPTKPHQSRTLLHQAIAEAGFAERSGEAHRVLGATDQELRAYLVAAGFTDYRSDLRSLVDLHSDVDTILGWSEASAFGNFLEDFSPPERETIRRAFAALLEARRTPDGIRLERYLRFAFVRKPATRDIAPGP